MNDMTNRRKFLKGGAIAGAAAVGTLAAPSIAKAEPVTLKMQSGWGGGIFQENAQSMLTASMQWQGRRSRLTC